MASSTPPTTRQHWSPGRGFTSVDPERQREVVGYVRSGPIEAVAASRSTAQPAARPAHRSWARATPDPEGSFEGSSSGRWR